MTVPPSATVETIRKKNPFVADPAMPEGIVPVASLPVEKEPCDSNVVNDSISASLFPPVIKSSVNAVKS